MLHILSESNIYVKFGQQAMFSFKIQAKITKLIHRPSFSTTLFNNSPVTSSPSFHNPPNTKSQLLTFGLHSSRIPLQEFSTNAVLPIKASLVSRTCTMFPHSAGDSSHAPQLFDEMPHRKQQDPQCSQSWDVFKIVRYVNKQPNRTHAAMVHALAVKQGALTDLYTATSLLTVYSRCKEFVSSLALFDEVLQKDVVFWNAMISSYIETNRVEAAIGFFKKMVGEGNEFDQASVFLVVKAFSSLKDLQQGQVAHGLSIKGGMLSDTVLSNAVIDMYAKCSDLSSSECAFYEVESKDLVTWNSIITGCFYNLHPEKSLWYLRRLVSCENQADNVSISCALAACSCLKEHVVGLTIHAWATKLGYAENLHISIANSLISFYSQIRDIYAAECVFNDMIVKNVVSWNTMVKGLFLNGEATKAFNTVRDMQLVASIQPDITSMVTIIPFCAELMLLREGKAAHGFIVRREMASEISVVNSLINMYSKCNRVEEAVCLFLSMPKKDLVAWNTMIFGYAQNGQSCEAQTLFKKMMGCCSTFTLPTLLAVIPSCDSPDSLQLGRSIHGWGIKLGFLSQIFALNSLMHMYISCGALWDAFSLFKRTSIQVDVTSWNTVIAGCSQKGHFWEALEYFNLMRKQAKVYFSSVILGSVISACGNLGLALEGKFIHVLALKTPAGIDTRVQNSLVTMYGRLGDSDSARLAFNLSQDHNLCSWNCVISAMSRNEDAKKALELFRSLEFEPNEITISTVLSACTQLGSISYGKQIHGHVFRFNFHKNPFISAALTDLFSNCGRLDISEQVFRYSSEKSVSSWNSLISAYGFHNVGKKAIETFHDMIASGVRPTNGSFTSLLSACSHAGLVDEGRKYYHDMYRKYKVVPTAEHHVCMVDMLGRSGRLNEAHDFIKKLQTQPEAGVWGALLSACSYHGDLEMGKQVAEILFALEPENVGYRVALCNMYVAAGRWEEAVELRMVIEDKQLKKPAGYSSIDVG